MTSFITTTKMTDRSVAASCTLGSSTLAALRGTGLSAICAGSPALIAAPVALLVSERNERPAQAPVAVLAAEAQAHGAYGFAAAAGAGSKTKQTKKQHHLMWAHRGLEPWSDPV
ncbi:MULTISPECIES: hypothetical protein [unclassified Streptomyces]|uniref:hypothetical protein n=1 Tax=unclassified Streptomyces TaxID=2593676 RepID=UPI000DC7BC70|nr:MULTISPECIES: hypothetical protein [unclassified Streptomyces]AWZ05727.1 hypothetical protein DRB89_14910 [Streptomyces sp. ICC4]AWZ16440.1 hypothetical protein DRB96_34205 [Streptomyces sp. ICC1]